MAWTYDGSPVSASATSTGLTQSVTVAATADLFVCGIAIRSLDTVSSITYAGAALSLAKDQVNGGGADEHCAIYYKVAPATGTNNLVVSLSGSVLHYVSIFTFTATNTPSLDVVGGAGGATTAVSASVSGAVGTLGVDCVVTETNVNPPFSALGADQTQIHNVTQGSFGIATSYELNPASNEQFDWTQASSGTEDWGHAVAIFKEAASGTTITMPAAGILNLAGLAPVTKVTPVMPVGILNLAGLPPVTKVNPVVPAGVLNLVGMPPQVNYDFVVTMPQAGVLNLAGLPPTIIADGATVVTMPQAGVLNLVGNPPVVTYTGVVEMPAAGILNLVGNAPTIDNGVAVLGPMTRRTMGFGQ